VTDDPKHTPFRDSGDLILDNGYAGPLGAASSMAFADCIVLDMMSKLPAVRNHQRGGRTRCQARRALLQAIKERDQRNNFEVAS